MSHENKIILVGTSLNEPSDGVLGAALNIARSWGAGLQVHHAYPLPVAYFVAPTGMTAVSPNLIDTERQVREAMLDEQLQRCGIERGDLAGVTIEPGAPHRMLLECAETVSADLIVVGASETLGKKGRGSTADRILRKATCPVWIVGEGHQSLPPVRVLAAVDLSPLSAECLGRGFELMDELEGCGEVPIDILFVLTPEERESSSQFTPDQIERLAKDELGRFAKGLPGGRKHPLRHIVRIGEVRDEIVDEAEDRAPPLVMIGTHGRSGFERLLLGSVASDVASQGYYDVLVIPPVQATA